MTDNEIPPVPVPRPSDGSFGVLVSTERLIRIIKRELDRTSLDQIVEIAAVLGYDLTEAPQQGEKTYWEMQVTPKRIEE